ncbi:biotin--[acetyl-CoA-carboxylase] ligase [Microbacterium sp. BLY]|uniref:biotin--[acetyl-CoA-carboxylase] ligase n=1 Tax=Microbacterium sp. BLY TaxID=2823280 RepID=UPI001B34546D|nr:biotin--[acetyl-CoA-carboxylase] ligase [Microbacterium sp. BLY]MBP3977945.1 biotin--[acetyl-CoA-carboxylase] ligase [Microbacterium sp. BLY]
MSGDLPLSAARAGRLEVLAATGSTNADLRARTADVEGWPHLSVLLTRDQTAGRGRLDRRWEAPAGTALAVSVLLRALPADPAARGWIPLAAGVAMAEAVAAQLPADAVALKWPNDVLVDGRKICGILAEAGPDTVIVGAGVNTAMTTAQLPVPTATSFAVQGVAVDEDALLHAYLTALDRHLTALAAAGDARSSGLHEAVTARCATIGQRVRVALPGGAALEGTAVGIDDEGRLLVEVEGAVHAVSAGDVVHVRPA